jgi:hypothetical protein
MAIKQTLQLVSLSFPAILTNNTNQGTAARIGQGAEELGVLRTTCDLMN